MLGLGYAVAAEMLLVDVALSHSFNGIVLQSRYSR